MAAALLGGGAVLWSIAPAAAGDAAHRTVSSGPVTIETVLFGDGRQVSVRLVRGAARARTIPAPPQGQTQIVSFGTGFAEQVTIVRGGTTLGALLVRHADLAARSRSERISFGDSRLPGVTIMRGAAAQAVAPIDLFGPANGGELGRIAFAVDGVESRHGADPRMWRPEPSGPQGPMQVSAAAALDVGGGDRFDLRQNRLLGRAYLAQMYQRYGNWMDALAAYNWGPGNLDQWIAGGRSVDRLPLDVLRYVERVLRDALITTASRL